MNISIIIIIVVCCFTGCVDSDYQPKKVTPIATEIVIEKITLNVCQTDPENADIWQRTKVNIFNEPGGLVIVGELPACSSITLDVLEKRTFKGLEFYKISYGNFVGWQTKRLLTGKE